MNFVIYSPASSEGSSIGSGSASWVPFKSRARLFLFNAKFENYWLNVPKPINTLRSQKRPFLSQNLDLVIISLNMYMTLWKFGIFFTQPLLPLVHPPDDGLYSSTKPSTWFTAAHFGLVVRQSYISSKT